MTRSHRAITLLAFLLGCTADPVRQPIDTLEDTAVDDDTDDTSPADSGPADACDLGRPCNPIQVSSFPFADARDTSVFPDSLIDAYGCDPSIDERGPELFYRVVVPSMGALSVVVTSAPGVDVDVHLLGSDDPDDCLIRAHVALGWVVEPGVYTLVVDSWVNASGEAQSGAFDLDLDLLPLDAGPCRTDPLDLRMFWSSCAPMVDCYLAPDSGGTTRAWLRTPAYGPLVREAHLVTTTDVAHLDGGWPSSLWDGIPGHYTRTAAASGYAMSRAEPWAPDGEGNAHFGQGATGAPVPPLDETWYVNMYWRDRPTKGTRMLVLDPFSGRAVVASGGYETGPGSHTAIGGATEEIHHWLGTTHRAPAVIGFLADQALPLGPIDCF